MKNNYKYNYQSCFDEGMDIEDNYTEEQNYYTYTECMELLENIKDEIFLIKLNSNPSKFYRGWLSDLCDNISDIQNHLPFYSVNKD